MKTVFISGWGTTDQLWSKVPDTGLPAEYVTWSRVIQGDFCLDEDCILVGWSLGGQLAINLSREPAVQGLVLLASMTCITAMGQRPGIEPERSSMISKMLYRSRRGYLRSFFMECGASGDDLENLLEQSDSFSMEELVSGLSVMFNHTAEADGTTPAVIVHGTEDRIIPCRVSAYLGSAVFADAKVITIQGADHLLPINSAELVGKVVSDLACHISA